jgi:hypothetical protein
MKKQIPFINTQNNLTNKTRNFVSGFIVMLSLAGISTNSFGQCETTTAPIIDTNIDAVWSDATINSISYVAAGAAQSGFSAQWRSVYTSTHLYYLVEVTKPGTLYNQNGSTNWWKDDAVEIYIDGDHSGGTSYDGVNDFQYGFRYNDGTNVLAGINNPSNSTTGITYDLYTTSAGYNVEISIPWSTVKTTPVIGNQMGIEAAVDISNGSGRLAQMTTFSNNSQLFTNPSKFGSVTFANCVVTTGIETGDNKSSNAFATPNPFSNQTTLTLPSNDNYTLSIKDMQGKQVKEITNISGGKTIITSDGMETGLYLYSLANQVNGSVYNGRFVVSK